MTALAAQPVFASTAFEEGQPQGQQGCQADYQEPDGHSIADVLGLDNNNMDEELKMAVRVTPASPSRQLSLSASAIFDANEFDPFEDGRCSGDKGVEAKGGGTTAEESNDDLDAEEGEDDSDSAHTTSTSANSSGGRKGILRKRSAGRTIDAKLWYHGRLNRVEAESRLRAAGRPGSFLVRASDRRPGSYVLSCLFLDGSIKHVRITASCGHFYIGAEVFESLTACVAYMTGPQAVWFTEEVIEHPVAPEKAVEMSKRQVIAVLPFCGMQDSDELSFNKGDIFAVEEELPQGWLWVTCTRTRECGLVYEGLVENLDRNLPLSELPYYCDHLSRDETYTKLTEAGEGSFVVRPSDSAPGAYTLCLNSGRRIEKFLITKRDNYYCIGNRKFETLHDIVQRYQETEICEGHCLVLPATWVAAEHGALGRGDAEEIYEKLDRDRLSVLRNKGIRASKVGNLFWKSKDYKKWKSMLIVLKENDPQVFVFESEKRAKPKAVIDLSFCTLFPVHYTLFDRPNAFQLVLNGIGGSTSFYLCAESVRDYTEWLHLLLPLCSGHKQLANNNSTAARSTSPSEVSLSHSDSGPDLVALGRVSEQPCPLSRMRHVWVKVYEVRRLPTKGLSDLYCVVSLNRAKVCRTSVKPASGCLVWDEDFCLADIPGQVSFLEVSLCHRSRSRRSKDTEIAKVWIDFSKRRTALSPSRSTPLTADVLAPKKTSLQDESTAATAVTAMTRHQSMADTMFDVSEAMQYVQWKRLIPTGHQASVRRGSSGDLGELKVEVKLTETLVMPASEYRTLKEALLANDFELCHRLGDLCQSDRARLATALLAVFNSPLPGSSDNAAHLELIVMELKREVDFCDDPNVLFRGSSLASSLLDTLMCSSAGQYVKNTLHAFVSQIVELKAACEINPLKVERDSDIPTNLSFLTEQLDAVLNSIYNSAANLPKSLRYILYHVRHIVSAKFGSQDELIALRAVGSFLFLRLLCVALTYPRRYYLLTDSIPQCAYKNLVLIAKIVQNLSSFAPSFSQKESYLDVLAPFLAPHRPRMLHFLRAVSAGPPPSRYDLHAACELEHDDPAKPLATVFDICLSNLNAIRLAVASSPTSTPEDETAPNMNESGDEYCVQLGAPQVVVAESHSHGSGLKSLLSVVELLCVHQKRYMQHLQDRRLTIC